ncbi:MAG: EamA family transporter [Clostridia bacterium]|nr:EamA family transporter [Clostridia bacterium]
MENLFWWGAVFVLIILYTLQSLFTKLYTEKYPGKPENAASVLTVASGITVVIITFFCFSLCSFTFNPYSILIGALNAVALYGYNYFIVKASSSGPYSILMMFNLSGGIIIPIIAALIMGWDSSWDTTFQIILNTVSILAIISAVYMVSVKKEASADGKSTESGKKSGISASFILSCLGLAVCNGVYGIFLTLQNQTEAAGGEANRDEMVITTFFFAALISFVLGLIREKGAFLGAFRQNKISAMYLIATSLVFALAINLIVIIIPHFDTTILYTIDNSSVLIMSVLISWIFFKEKLSRLNVIGISIMVLALVCMNLLPAIVL